MFNIRTIRGKLAAGFALGPIVLLIVGWIVYTSTEGLVERRNQLQQSYMVLQQAALLSRLLVDAETGQRGYVLTGEDSYLAPYAAAESGLNSALTRLAELSIDTPRQQARLAAIREAVRLKLAELSETIALRRSQGFDAALAIIRTDRGKKFMDDIRVALDQIIADENETLRQRIASNVATNLNPTYTVNNGLRIAAAEQALLDDTLANRTVEFDSGKATLTPTGRVILDEMVTAMLKLKGRRIEIIGHTDSAGLRASNVSLSQARAATVKAYLAAHGIAEDTLTASGQGPDRPIASNDTVEGRARNRRIEFRLVQ